MNSKRLEHFLEIVRSGSLGKAAERMHMAQPALSRELRELEMKLGAQLLRRHAKGVDLTPAGEAFKNKAEGVVVENIQEEVNSAVGKPFGHVAFRLPASMSDLLAGPLIHEFSEANPSVKVQLRDGASVYLRGALLSKELDFAVLTAPISEPRLVSRPLLSERMFLVGPPDADFKAEREISLRDLSSIPLIMPPTPNPNRLVIGEFFESHGMKPNITLETDTVRIAQFIANGVGCSILPSCAVSSYDVASRSLACIPIKELTIMRLLVTPAGTNQSIAANAMIKALCDNIKKLIANHELRGIYVGP